MDHYNVLWMKVEDLVPYPNNPRVNDGAVDDCARSIEQFGFRYPILIDKNNVIISGHTRRKAALKLGLVEVPAIRADDLPEDKVRALRLVDNKVAEKSMWDETLLNFELGEIECDLSEFGFELPDFEDLDLDDDADPEEDDGWYGDERERTNKAYNLDIVDPDNLTNDFWQMPIIHNDGYIPKDLIGFNYAKTSKRKNTGVHFYVDDDQFERVWNNPEKYLDVLLEYDCILSPDFSLYMDMPMPMKIWNIYRSRQIGAYYQSYGIKVIPTISWAEAATFAFCFQGIEKGSVVSISTIGVKRDPAALEIWRAGVAAMIEHIEPSAIVVYGGKLEYDYGIPVYYFENKVTEAWKGD
ncbi:MAG: DUF4417 domain-containing protein [Oscillospiraceae bacterium]|nr:DUF4417 domain-containing protein [Oscillospiraceae bacterium]